MKIVYAASEAEPFIKTGGLADVMGALPKKILEKSSCEVTVFLPLYEKVMLRWFGEMVFAGEFFVDFSQRQTKYSLYKCYNRGITYYFVDNRKYFDRENEYGYYDDGERFAFFSKAVVDSVVKLGIYPDILHCNDWHTALVTVYKKAVYRKELLNTKTIFTIHNMEYQGVCDYSFLNDILMLDSSFEDCLAIDEKINIMKGGLECADYITTVSRSYAEEIKNAQYSNVLANTVKNNSFKLKGIVNGIDFLKYDPHTDKNLPFNYTLDNHLIGKSINKRILQDELSLNVGSKIPLISIVSRIVKHKGFELICKTVEKIIKSGCQLVILGVGDIELENVLLNMSEKYNGRMSVNLRFDDVLASKIYAASDMYLMPSESEPCGLSQLIAMRYGTIPIVHSVGGLKDTVISFDKNDLGNGYTFDVFTEEVLLGTINNAMDVYLHDRKKWDNAIENAMCYDSSWDLPSEEYFELYNKVL